MKLTQPSDFEFFTNKTDRVIASTIANDIATKKLKQVINDHTKGAPGLYAEGYRDCISQILRDLESK